MAGGHRKLPVTEVAVVAPAALGHRRQALPVWEEPIHPVTCAAVCDTPAPSCPRGRSEFSVAPSQRKVSVGKGGDLRLLLNVRHCTLHTDCSSALGRGGGAPRSSYSWWSPQCPWRAILPGVAVHHPHRTEALVY